MPPITPHDWQRLAPLIDRLLDAGDDQRPALLDELAEGDAGRRQDLARLVEECERPDPLLDHPAEALATLLVDEGIPVPGLLAGRYRIVRELGRGGMAVVYLAGDLRHAREVAVKVVRPEVATVLGRDRFLREIAIAARLNHPGIVPLHDSGEADGLLYYVMPFESGLSLRGRLVRDGPLPVDEAVRLLHDVCEALAYAHEQGIVHRDIKPDNVLLSGRRALVTDFGVAKALTEAGAASSRTGAAVVLGTPAYMAPEQIGSDPRVDQRADIYAVGLLAYELLAGSPPFQGETSREILAAHLAEPPPPLAPRRPDLPPALTDLVMKCLEKRPEDRWQEAGQLVQRLEALSATAGLPPIRTPRRAWIAGAAAFAAIALGLLGAQAWHSARAGRSASPRELFIVADFVNRTSDSALGTLAADVIRDELAGSPRLASLSRARIADTRRRMRIAPEVPLTAEIARELAVREEIKLIVEGTVSGAGPGYALSARIVETASGDVIHAATAMARDSTDITPAIERLSRGLRPGLGEPLAPIQAPTGALWSYTTKSLPALQTLQLAIASRAAGDFLRAVEVVREAVALDPDFAIAHLAVTSNMELAGLPTGSSIPGLVRAYGLADSLPVQERRAVEAFYHRYVTGDLARSIAAFQGHLDAVMKAPREAGFVGEAATALQLNGETGAAERVVAEVKTAMERGGGTWGAGRSSGGVQLTHLQLLHALGRDAEATQILSVYRGHRPDNITGMRFTIGFLADSGRYDLAHELAGRIRRASGLRNDLRLRAEADAVRGRIAEAAGHLRELRDQAMALGHPGAAVEIAAAAARLRLVAADSGGIAEVDGLLPRLSLDTLDVLSRPYLPLALFYAQTGRPGRARTWLRRYEREFPQEYQGPDRWMIHRIRSAALAAEGDFRRSLAELRKAARFPAMRAGMFDEPLVRTTDHPELARLYHGLGEGDSAIAVYRRYLDVRSLTRLTLDGFERGPALEAMAALYAVRGEDGLATSAYCDFADLWREADAGLQPRVETARRRAGDRCPD
jgi:tetratricopeptide (TPR) repeat protein